MNYQNKFSIYCDATRLVIEMEDAVRDFPRYHKYTLGSEMRTIAYDLGRGRPKAVGSVWKIIAINGWLC
jgi:lipid-binding SYLF domain-containing protein